VSPVDIIPTTDRATALVIAARAECDPRTARRALDVGPHTIRTLTVRDRVTRVMREMGLAPPERR
jgi:hypothetical protein